MPFNENNKSPFTWKINKEIKSRNTACNLIDSAISYEFSLLFVCEKLEKWLYTRQQFQHNFTSCEIFKKWTHSARKLRTVSVKTFNSIMVNFQRKIIQFR